MLTIARLPIQYLISSLPPLLSLLFRYRILHHRYTELQMYDIATVHCKHTVRLDDCIVEFY